MVILSGLTAEQVEEARQARAMRVEDKELQAYLDSTAWYVIRKLETGEAIPESVAQERSTAQARLSEIRGG